MVTDLSPDLTLAQQTLRGALNPLKIGRRELRALPLSKRGLNPRWHHEGARAEGERWREAVRLRVSEGSKPL